MLKIFPVSPVQELGEAKTEGHHQGSELMVIVI